MNVWSGKRLYRQQHNSANQGQEEDDHASPRSLLCKIVESAVRKKREKSRRKQDKKNQHYQRHQCLDTHKPQVIKLDVKEPYVVRHGSLNAPGFFPWRRPWPTRHRSRYANRHFLVTSSTMEHPWA